jgi:hypothetical protein
MTVTTPEGKVKQRIKGLLGRYAPYVWYDMPVPGGYGKSTLDFMGSAWGLAFAIEAKAGTVADATLRQRITANRMARAGVEVFTVCGGSIEEDLIRLEFWLQAVRNANAGKLWVVPFPEAEPPVFDQLSLRDDPMFEDDDKKVMVPYSSRRQRR